MFITRHSSHSLSKALNTPMRTYSSQPVRVEKTKPDSKPENPNLAPTVGSGGPTGFIVVRLNAGAKHWANPEIKSLRQLADIAQLEALGNTLEEFGLDDGRRLISGTDPGKLRDLEEQARKSEFPPLHSLLSYWLVDARKRAQRLDELVQRLRSLPGVDHAYAHSSGALPLVDASDDTYALQQGHLDAAPTGIDARWAWTQPNGEGVGIAVADVEYGWVLTHEDFASKTLTLIEGDQFASGFDHGTAVLGEMIADDNALGVIGIAPEAGPVSVSSTYDAGTGVWGFVAEAVVACITALSPGDVVVIEWQTTAPDPFGAPAELVDDTFDAVRLASALGLIVFAAAGNGGQDLDTITNSSGNQVLNPASPDFRDSGAIICGAAEDALPHNRAIWSGGQSSSFGARVNCFGWGRNVVTTGYGDLDDGGGDTDREYTDTFAGTSSATPIVAGAGLLLQGMQFGNTGARLSPAQMRLMLSNPATGTAQGGGVAGNIGVMPDLRAIIEDELGLNADVYLRDNVGDDGSVPAAGSISASPDIIVRPFALLDPDAAFGEGSGFENSTDLGYRVEAGQDNYIYVRMKNRGSTDASGVSCRVYWSDVSTLVTPAMWTLIGTTTPMDVTADDTLFVTTALVWNKADIPGEGHYCFVGILDHPADPAPVLPGPADWNGFRNFIRNQNNVTWRNFNVIDDVFDPAPTPYILEFLVANFPDRRRVFDFVIERRIQPRVDVWLEVPLSIAKPFLRGQESKTRIDRRRGTAHILLPGAPRMVVPNVLLPADARMKCRFLVEGMAKAGRPGSMLSISQQFEEQEVGRVTWRFLKRRDPKQQSG